MFSVILSPEAADFFARSDRPLARKLSRCFAQLERDPIRHNNIKRLKGRFGGLYRYRVGDWRAIYEVHDAARQVNVLSIAHRSEIYEQE